MINSSPSCSFYLRFHKFRSLCLALLDGSFFLGFSIVHMYFLNFQSSIAFFDSLSILFLSALKIMTPGIFCDSRLRSWFSWGGSRTHVEHGILMIRISDEKDNSVPKVMIYFLFLFFCACAIKGLSERNLAYYLAKKMYHALQFDKFHEQRKNSTSVQLLNKCITITSISAKTEDLKGNSVSLEIHW